MRLWKFSQIELELKQYFFIPAVCVFIGSRRLNMKNASFTFLIADLPRGLWTKAFLWKNSQIKLVKMTPVSVFQVSNFLSYSHYTIKGPYEKKTWFRPGRHRHMNSQIMENVIQYYLHVYDSALRIYSQKKSEYRTANYLYCGVLG